MLGFRKCFKHVDVCDHVRSAACGSWAPVRAQRWPGRVLTGHQWAGVQCHAGVARSRLTVAAFALCGRLGDPAVTPDDC